MWLLSDLDEKVWEGETVAPSLPGAMKSLGFFFFSALCELAEELHQQADLRKEQRGERGFRQQNIFWDGRR